MNTTLEFAEWDTGKVAKYANKIDTIFHYNEDVDKTAYLNWRMGFGSNSRRQFIVMGEAFFSTAFNLVQQSTSNNSDKKADLWIFPIMFNVVHGIEVYLKAINACLNVVLGKAHTNIEGGHDIKQLCNVAKSLIIEYKNINKCDTTAQMFTAIKAIGNFIENIYQKTDDMTFARYPMAKNKNGHFYIQTLENEVVDLEMLQEQMVIIYKLLDFIYEMPELELEIESDMMMDCY